MPIGEAWEIKYHSSKIFHGDYFGFKIHGNQDLCETTSSPSTFTTSSTTTTTDSDVVIIDNCDLTNDCDNVGRTAALETTTPFDDVPVPTPAKRIVG